MRMRFVVLFSAAAILIAALTGARVEANSSIQQPRRAPAAQLHRCANDYSQDEIDAMIANGEDGYEPDDCPLLAHTLTGPELHNFCQPGDEDWVRFIAKPDLIYQIKAESPVNYATEPHLDLLEADGTLIAQNDHYFGNNAEIWWWNSNAERTVYIRATELRGRHDCGNSAYTLSLHAFIENPYPPATVQPTSTLTLTPSPTPTSTSLPIETPDATPTPGG